MSLEVFCPTPTPTQTSRRHTTHLQAAHLAQLPLGADLGKRGWVHRNLSLHIAESRRDRAEVAEVVKRRHYLRRWPAKPRTLLMSYIGSLGGEGAAAVVMVGMMPTNLGGLLPALGVHQAEVLQALRSWRADDLGPDTTPDLMPQVLRCIVKRVAADWAERKCANLAARPRLLVTWADPSPGVQHDGQLYVGAGAAHSSAAETSSCSPGPWTRACACPCASTRSGPGRSHPAHAHRHTPPGSVVPLPGHLELRPLAAVELGLLRDQGIFLLRAHSGHPDQPMSPPSWVESHTEEPAT